MYAEIETNDRDEALAAVGRYLDSAVPMRLVVQKLADRWHVSAVRIDEVSAESAGCFNPSRIEAPGSNPSSAS